MWVASCSVGCHKVQLDDKFMTSMVMRALTRVHINMFRTGFEVIIFLCKGKSDFEADGGWVCTGVPH